MRGACAQWRAPGAAFHADVIVSGSLFWALGRPPGADAAARRRGGGVHGAPLAPPVLYACARVTAVRVNVGVAGLFMVLGVSQAGWAHDRFAHPLSHNTLDGLRIALGTASPHHAPRSPSDTSLAEEEVYTVHGPVEFQGLT